MFYCSSYKYSIAAGKAFCSLHCDVIAAIKDDQGNQRYSTDLRGFLRSCSNEETQVDPNNYTKEMRARVKEEILRIARHCEEEGTSPEFVTAAEAQGTDHLVTEGFTADSFDVIGGTDKCNKYVCKTTNYSFWEPMCGDFAVERTSVRTNDFIFRQL